MPQGLDQREVINAPGPSGRANAPARQLGLVQVQAPRGGRMDQVGAGYKVLAEAVKLGGRALSGYLDKKRNEDIVAGEMDLAEGRTEHDLIKAGANPARLEGFRALKLKTAYNQWHTQSMRNIELKDKELSTEEYKQQLHEGFRELSDSIDPDDTNSHKLLASLAADGFSKLVSTHVAARTEYASAESGTTVTNLIISEGETGDTESLNAVVENIDTIANGMGKEEVDASILSAIRQTLNKGNFAVFDAFGQMPGLKDRNLSEAELESVNAAYKTAQTMQESENMSEIGSSFHSIMEEVKVGNLSRDEAFSRLKDLQEQYRLSEGYIRTMANSVDKIYFSQKWDEKLASFMYDPKYMQAKTNLIREVGYQGLQSTDAINKALAIADKFKLPHDMVMDDLKAVALADNTFQKRQNRELDDIIKARDHVAELDRKASALRNSNFSNITAASAEVKQRAMAQQLGIIIDSVVMDDRFSTDEERNAEVIRRHVAFMRNVSVRDKDIQRDFQVVGQSPPLDEKGNLNAAHIQALKYVSTMQEAGLNERTIKEYAGESYEYLTTASYLTRGAVDPMAALSLAWEQTQVPKEDRITPKADVDAILEEWVDVKEEFFDDIEPGVWAAMFGAESDASYDEVLTFQVKEAAENSEDLDAWAKRRVKLYATTYPMMNEGAIMNLLKRDLSKWDYVMGNLVPPRGGKSMTEEMGIADLPGKLKGNSAAIMYMHEFADELFPVGSAEATFWKSFADGDVLDYMQDKVAGAVERSIYEPEKMHEGSASIIDTAAGKLQSVVMFASETEQRLANDLKMVDITPMSGGHYMIALYKTPDKKELVGVPRVVRAKDMGDLYRIKTAERQFEEHLPRR